MVLDGGSWDNASLLFPCRDPYKRKVFGATELELQAIAGYKDAMRRIKLGKGPQDPKNEEGENNGKDGQGKGGNTATFPPCRERFSPHRRRHGP